MVCWGEVHERGRGSVRVELVSSVEGRAVDEREVPGVDIVGFLVRVSIWLRNRLRSDMSVAML